MAVTGQYLAGNIGGVIAPLYNTYGLSGIRAPHSRVLGQQFSTQPSTFSQYLGTTQWSNLYPGYDKIKPTVARELYGKNLIKNIVQPLLQTLFAFMLLPTILALTYKAIYDSSNEAQRSNSTHTDHIVNYISPLEFISGFGLIVLTATYTLYFLKQNYHEASEAYATSEESYNTLEDRFMIFHKLMTVFFCLTETLDEITKHDPNEILMINNDEIKTRRLLLLQNIKKLNKETKILNEKYDDNYSYIEFITALLNNPLFSKLDIIQHITSILNSKLFDRAWHKLKLSLNKIYPSIYKPYYLTIQDFRANLNTEPITPLKSALLYICGEIANIPTLQDHSGLFKPMDLESKGDRFDHIQAGLDKYRKKIKKEQSSKKINEISDPNEIDFDRLALEILIKLEQQESPYKHLLYKTIILPDTATQIIDYTTPGISQRPIF